MLIPGNDALDLNVGCKAQLTGTQATSEARRRGGNSVALKLGLCMGYSLELSSTGNSHC